MNLFSDSPAFRSAIEAARRVDCGQCAALAGDECVYTTAPVSVPVTVGTPVRPVRGYHAERLALAASPVPRLPPSAIVWDNGDEPRLPDGADDIAGEIDATAAGLLSRKIIALREYVGRPGARPGNTPLGPIGLPPGGVLTQYLSWRWCLYVNLIFAGIAAAGAVRLLHRQPAPGKPRLDRPWASRLWSPGWPSCH